MNNELQFVLIVVVLVILVVILYSRLGRFERYLKRLEGIPLLEDRLHGLAESLDHLEGSNGTARVEQQLSEVQALLVQIRDALDSSAQGSREAGVLTHMPIPGDWSIADLAERKLYNLGYQEVSIITDLSDVNPNEPIRVVVEAKKDGAIYKGHMTIHGSSMVEMDLQPSFTSFP